MSHAKNMAARCGMLERAEILVTLDADNFTRPGFARYIAEQMADQPFPGAFLCPNFPHIQSLPHGPGRPLRGFAGRLAIRAHDFVKLGGYDESYDTWRGEDIDMIARLQRLGYQMRHIDNRYLGVIPHNAEVRFAEYPHARQYENKGEVQAIHARSNTLVNFGKIGLGKVCRNFGTHSYDVGRVPTRVFGIGLHKTGTTSLDAAFQILGLSSFHWGKGESPRIWQEANMQGGRSQTMERWYAFSDLPFPLIYRQLDKAYPGSKFILTVRSEDKWIKSVERLWDPKFNPTRWVWDKWPFTNTIHIALYGRSTFDREVFLARYRRHNAEVQDYFRGRETDLLVMNAGDGWSKIAGFLGLPTPRVPYPMRNQTVDVAEKVCVTTEEVVRVEEYRAWVNKCPNYSQENVMPMPNHNTVNNWGALLTVVDPSTQQCTFPFPFFDAAGNRLSPFVADPVLVFPNGYVEHLASRYWANTACANFIARILGGTLTTKAPPDFPQITETGYVYGQQHFWIVNTNGNILDPADLVQKFLDVGNKAALQQAIPAMLGIAPQV